MAPVASRQWLAFAGTSLLLHLHVTLDQTQNKGTKGTTYSAVSLAPSAVLSFCLMGQCDHLQDAVRSPRLQPGHMFNAVQEHQTSAEVFGFLTRGTLCNTL